MKNNLVTIAKWSRNALNDKCLSTLDGHGSSRDPIPYSPVFILGAPRCGSTLLSQLVTQCLEVGYFTNFHAQLYGSPALAERLRPSTAAAHESDYRSQHGVTRGWNAPSENAAFWYRFFRRNPAYVPLAEMSESKAQAFRRSISRFVEACNSPVVIKNLYAALRLEVIEHYLPEARYIVLHRNVADNATSILRSRKKVFGTYSRWWSVEVPNHHSLQTVEPVQQVLSQIHTIYDLIKTTEQTASPSLAKFLHLNYEDLCDQPANTMHQIGQFIPNCEPRATAIQQLPLRFDRRSQHVEDLQVQQRLKDLIDL
jgi:hypothetical protein